MNEGRMLKAWRQAADDLGIRLEYPFSLTTPAGAVPYLARICDFGAVKGMLLISGKGSQAHHHAASAAGFGYSCLYESYEVYSRNLFVETLNDWGWCNASKPAPEWYSGQPWSD